MRLFWYAQESEILDESRFLENSWANIIGIISIKYYTPNYFFICTRLVEFLQLFWLYFEVLNFWFDVLLFMVKTAYFCIRCVCIISQKLLFNLVVRVFTFAIWFRKRSLIKIFLLIPSISLWVRNIIHFTLHSYVVN